MSTGLARARLDFREVCFQALAAIAPAGALTVSIAVASNYAGGALPLAVIFGFLPCLTVAIAIGSLSRHLTSAGSIYTFPARALHPDLGFLVGWGYALAAATWCPAVGLAASTQIAGLLAAGKASAFHAIWPVSFLIACLLALALGYRGIALSTRVGTLVGTVELGAFLLLAVGMILAAGKANSSSPFTLKFANAAGFQGISGVLAGAVFVLQSFVGFEAAAPLAEETRNPEKNILRATVFACVATGVFFTIMTYAAVVLRGPAGFSNFGASLENGNPWIPLSQRVWGAGWLLVFAVGVTSNLGAQNAFSNASSRTAYALARIRLIPGALAAVHPRWRSPHRVVFAQFAFTVAAGGATALLFGPVDATILLATICTAIPLMVYILINISCVVFFWREKRKEFHWLLHGVLPLGGALLLVPILLTALGVGSSVAHFVQPLSWPISLTGPILGLWFVVGFAYLVFLRRRFPERLTMTARIFSEAETSQEDNA